MHFRYNNERTTSPRPLKGRSHKPAPKTRGSNSHIPDTGRVARSGLPAPIRPAPGPSIPFTNPDRKLVINHHLRQRAEPAEVVHPRGWPPPGRLLLRRRAKPIESSRHSPDMRVPENEGGSQPPSPLLLGRLPPHPRPEPPDNMLQGRASKGRWRHIQARWMAPSTSFSHK